MLNGFRLQPLVEFDAYREILEENDRLRAENETLRSALSDVTDFLEDCINEIHPNRDAYANTMRRYLRDMEPVNKARAAIRGEG